MVLTEKSQQLAEAAAAERLLNAYLRETCQFNPLTDADPAASASLPVRIREELSEQGSLMRLVLQGTKKVVWGAVPYVSAFGHHRYGTSFFVTDVQGDGAGDSDIRPLTGSVELAELLLREIAQGEPQMVDREERVATLLNQVENSLDKTKRYVTHSLNQQIDFWQTEGEVRMYTAEQSLAYGHPFHPTPKSSVGFSETDLAKYAPEMGAAFALHYFAAAPQLVQEAFLSQSDEGLFPASVLAAAEQRLSGEQQGYRLLPSHPWQADHLKTWPEVQELLEQGLLVDLGPLGEPVYPTSSVRTVWDPTHAYFFKLPLNVRITNFVRVNPLEQLERTIGAASVLSHLADLVPHSGFTILQEAGYRTLVLPQATEAVREKLAESFGVIFRENPVIRPADEVVPLCIAPLLETAPDQEEPPMLQAIRTAAQEQGEPMSHPFLKKWLRAYLEHSLVPLTYLFVEYGVSIEAHVQNSMVTLKNGWPVGFYVRDLEGVSISRERAEKHGMFGGRVATDSPALYRDDETWNRLKYYFFVNHLGHLIHTLAYHGGDDEIALWQVVSNVLATSGVFAGDARRYLQDLFTVEGLPAKANLISRFQKRGETPAYVAIPNPLRKSEVQHEHKPNNQPQQPIPARNKCLAV